MESRQSAGVYGGGNAILDQLSERERKELLPHLSVYVAEETSVLYNRDQLIEAVYFPIDAIYAVVVELPRGFTYEVDLIGRNGAVGVELAIGAQRAARTVLCEAGGYVARMARDNFMLEFARSHSFLLVVWESLRRQWFESQQTVACNYVHTLPSRAARWILMARDELSREPISLRREVLSIMLGVTAKEADESLAILALLGCIRYEGQEITVVSREELRKYACDCYVHQVVRPFLHMGQLT